MSMLDQVRKKYGKAIHETSKASKSPSAGSAGPKDSVSQNSCRLDPTLEARVRSMATRWGYAPDELSAALTDASRDPSRTAAWCAHDERHFGHCSTPADFAAAYRRLHGLH